MRIRVHVAAWIALSVVSTGRFTPLNGADTKADKKRSQVSLQRALQADKAGRRDEAIAAYTDAIAADNSNGAAFRGRGKDYLAAGDKVKAAEDLEQAVRVQPADAQSYSARGELFAALGEPERAIRDFDTAIGMKTRAERDLHGARQCFCRHPALRQGNRRFYVRHQAAARQPGALQRSRDGVCRSA